MYGSFARAIGMITIKKHPKNGYGANSTQHQTYLKVTKSGKRLDNERSPERVSIKSSRDQKEDDPEFPDGGISQRYTDIRSESTGFSLGCKFFYQPLAFRWTEPACCF